VGSSFGNGGAEVEDFQTLAKLHDEPHRMLDEKDRGPEFLAYPAKKVHEPVDFSDVEPGGRLVEQKKLRPRRKRARELEPSLQAVGQMTRRRAGVLVELEPFEKIHRALACKALFAAILRSLQERGARAVVCMRTVGDAHVVEDRQLLEE